MWRKSVDLGKINEGEPPPKKLFTDGDLLIRNLVKKQTNTKLNLNEQLNVKNDFQKATEFISLTNYTSGTSSLEEFNKIYKEAEEIEQLKGFDLTKDEVDLYFDRKLGDDYFREKYRNINKDILERKLEKITEKIGIYTENEAELSTKTETDCLEKSLMLSSKPNSIETKLLKFAIENEKITKEKLPHPMDTLKDIETKLFPNNETIEINIKKIRKKARNLGNKINSIANETTIKPPKEPQHLMSQVKQSKWDIKEEIIVKEKPKKIYTCKPQNYYTIKDNKIIKLEENIHKTNETKEEKNKISIEEIKELLRFKDYNPGTPSKILYLKNLSEKATVADLEDVFKNVLSIKLMKGRMRGQAFITFLDIETAVKNYDENNGLILKGKPIIIEYGKKEPQCV